MSYQSGVQRAEAGGCEEVRITRTALIALRDSAGLSAGCPYTIVDPNAQGNLDVVEVQLFATTLDMLGMDANILTTHETTPWSGSYDIDANDVLEVVDNRNNKVIGNAPILTFPFGVAAVTYNTVFSGGTLAYTAGTVSGNKISNNSNVTVISGSFSNNIVDTDANVTSSGNTNRNHFEAQSSTTVNSGDFLENRVEGNATVISSTTGDVDNNVFKASSNATINSGNFDNNEIHSDANVLIDGGVSIVRNHFYSASNTTINAGAFRNNQVYNDATVISSTTGDVDSNTFGNLSSTNISGTASLDNSTVDTDGNIVLSGGNVIACKIGQNANLTMSGGTFADSTIGEDAEVTIISGSNYENVFGASTVYRQVGTGYIRYSTIEGTTTWTNGNTNVSNVHSYVSSVNTTGSTGAISNSSFSRAIMSLMQNVDSLTITDCTISNYAQVSMNGAARMYLYRSTVTDGSRVLISAGARIDSSYTNVSSYGYLQCNQDGGVLTANYCEVSSNSYIRNITPNSHSAQRSSVSGNSRISFEGDSSGCRVYYSSASGGGSIYINGTSSGCFLYYCSAIGLGQVYAQNSTNARIYYCSASARGYIRSLNCPGTHYMYYCSATASGYVQMNATLGRMYAVHAASQSIVEKRGSQASNFYYSTFTAYYYAYVTKTTGTVSGLYGMGRRSYTITDPVTSAPYNQGVAWQNF